MSGLRTRCLGFGLLLSCLVMLVACGGPAHSILISPSAVLLAPAQTFQFNIARVGDAATSGPLPVLTVNGIAGGTPSTGTIAPDGTYTAPSSASSQAITVGIAGQSSSATVSIFNPNSFTPGAVVATQNPLVASYTIQVPAGASVYVQFGTDTSYGFPTSAVPSRAGGNVTILVAGMRASTNYHMRAVIDLATGAQAFDTDKTLMTGPIPANQLPSMTTQVFGTGAPSPGVELFSLVPDDPTPQLSAVATDLAGNVIWYYPLGPNEFPFPLKLLPNGHMLANVDTLDGTVNEAREIDLAGNIINSASIGLVNHVLAGLSPVPFQLDLIHHDIAVLPNGHWILIGNYPKVMNNVGGIPQGTSMLGDALVDWDPQTNTVGWTWSTFDHLDVTHAPFGFADWTHANAIIYSPTDGNLILSMRNQDWIIKVDYRDGAGAGDILWRFGPGGDFTLPGQEAPIDWNYGQHYPTILSPNSSGVFTMMFFDNGNFRFLDANDDICGTPGQAPCFSSVPIFQIDESTKTATLQWEDDLLPAFSTCCGDALFLPNGDVEYDIAADVNTPNFSHIQEATQSQNPELIWNMDIEGQLAYRGFRIPSLYPGVVWPATAQSSASRAVRPAPVRNSTGVSWRKAIGQLLY